MYTQIARAYLFLIVAIIHTAILIINMCEMVVSPWLLPKLEQEIDSQQARELAERMRKFRDGGAW